MGMPHPTSVVMHFTASATTFDAPGSCKHLPSNGRKGTAMAWISSFSLSNLSFRRHELNKVRQNLIAARADGSAVPPTAFATTIPDPFLLPVELVLLYLL